MLSASVLSRYSRWPCRCEPAMKRMQELSVSASSMASQIVTVFDGVSGQ